MNLSITRKMLTGCRDDSTEKHRNMYKICMYAGKTSDDGMRNKEQHEGKGKGWACNNHNMHNPTIKDVGSGYTCCMHAHPLSLPSRCSLFLMIMPSSLLMHILFQHCK